MAKRKKKEPRKKEDEQSKPFIFLPGLKALVKVLLNDIIYISGNGSYSDIHLVHRKTMGAISCNLSDFVAVLPYPLFFRSHDSYIINIEHIAKYLRNGQVEMDDSTTLDVSKSKRESLQSVLPRVIHRTHKRKK